MSEHADPFILTDEGGHCESCGDDEVDLRGVKFVSREEHTVMVCEGCIEEMNNAINAKWHK